MAGGPTLIAKSFLRIASLQGRSIIEAVCTNQFTVIESKGARILTATTVDGISIAWTVPPGMTTIEVMQYADEALTWFDAFTAQDAACGLGANATLLKLLTSRPLTKTRAGFFC